MQKSHIPIYHKKKGKFKINELFSIKWKPINRELYEGVEKPHRHDYYSILFLVEGETIQYIDFKEYKIKGQALLLMHPDQVHFDVDTKNAKILLITFKDNLLLGNKESFLWKHIFSHNVLTLDSPIHEDLLKYTDLIMHEYEQNHPSEKVISFLLSAFLEKIRGIADTHNHIDENNNRILQAYKLLVEQYALTEVKVSDYAKKLFISPGHLNDTIKKLTGRNAKSFINEQRVLEAKRLLYWTETSIQDIAWKTGFKDPAYFTRFFKKETGMLPLSFQKSAHALENFEV
jgi:AraC-like DNA-binding protein